MPMLGEPDITSWDWASTVSTVVDCQTILFGKGASVPRIHSSWSPRVIFHILGPSRVPMTSISSVVAPTPVAPAAASAEFPDQTGVAARATITTARHQIIALNIFDWLG